MDNLLCVQRHRFQRDMGGLAWLLEGHAWWHYGTGYGSYLIVVATQALILAKRQGADGLSFKWTALIVPYVVRSKKSE